MSRIAATLLGAVAAAGSWYLGLLWIFGPAQRWLADPARQSAKFIAAFVEEPYPRMAAQPEALWYGLLVIGLFHSVAFGWLRPRLGGPGGWAGLRFGLLAWALMVPWFEFYLPWNVMLEPLPLVLLEGLCWLGVQLLVGLALAAAHGLVSRATSS